MACVTTQDRQPSFQIFFSEGQRFTANELTTPPKKNNHPYSMACTTNACSTNFPLEKTRATYNTYNSFYVCMLCLVGPPNEMFVGPLEATRG